MSWIFTFSPTEQEQQAALEFIQRKAPVLQDTGIDAPPAIYTGPQSLRIDDYGIRQEWEHCSAAFAWAAAGSLEHCHELDLLLIGNSCILLPDRIFESVAERKACLDFIAARTAVPPSQAAAARPNGRCRRSAGCRLGSRIGTNVWAGARMALFFRVGESAIDATPLAILTLTALLAALHYGAALWAGDSPQQWFLPGHGLAGGTLPMGLGFGITALGMAIASVLATVGRRPDKLLPMLTAWLAVCTALDLLYLPLQAATDVWKEGRWFAHAFLLWPVWYSLAAATAMLRILDIGGYRRAFAWAGTALLLALPLINTFHGFGAATGTRDENQAADDPKYDALVREDAFYLQPRLLQHALDHLAAQRPTATDMYFVGVAGYAEPDVFLKEILAVEKLMGERFGAGGRSIALINNYHTATQYPLASASALRQTLKHIAERMDRENDMLFLFMTSHGSPDHQFGLDFWPLLFNQLTPETLRDMLDDSGIKWRVIVVSACYSGGFIEPLRNEHSIVISAAAADKSSFGCSDGNDWTYFGGAFFNEALRAHSDLLEAFSEARQTIERREQAEAIETKSDPRIAAGTAMRLKWSDYIRELGRH